MHSSLFGKQQILSNMRGAGAQNQTLAQHSIRSNVAVSGIQTGAGAFSK